MRSFSSRHGEVILKKFTYSLETVLNYKDSVLDRQKEEYAKRLAEAAGQRQKIETLEERQDGLMHEFDEVKRSCPHITDFLIYAEMTDAMTEQIRQEKAKLEQLEQRAEHQKQKVVEANVDVNRFEKLKEKKRQDYRKAEQKENETFIDEFVSHEAAVNGGAAGSSLG